MGVGAADGLADGPSLVAAEIVEDDEVAGPECRDQKLLDPGLEAAAVDRAVEDVWGAQAGEEGHGAPVAVGRVSLQAPALLRPASYRTMLVLVPVLIDEHRLSRIEPRFERAAARALPGDCPSGLLQGEQRFF